MEPCNIYDERTYLKTFGTIQKSLCLEELAGREMLDLT